MDILRRFSFVNQPIRGQWVRLSTTLSDASQFRAYPAPVQALLGQMLAAVAMIADNLKFSGAVALQSQGKGHLKRSLAECRDQGALRGIVHLNSEEDLPDAGESLQRWLQDGQLAISLLPDSDAGMQPYQGLVSLAEGDLAACMQAYFEQSEQLDTRLFFAWQPDTVTGLLLQRLPDDPKANEMAVEGALGAWETLTTLAATVRDEELRTLGPDALIQRLFNEFPCRLHDPRQLEYRCSCTPAKSDNTLMMLGREDLVALSEERDTILVDCEFCGRQYRYGAPEVEMLLTKLDRRINRGSAADEGIH